MHTTALLSEFIADTNPNDSNSYFRIQSALIDGVPVVLFESAEQRVYTLQFLSDLAGGSWSNVAGRVDVPGDPDGDDELDDPAPAGPGSYRIQVELE